MASVNLSGILKNPEGEPDVGAIVRFTLLTNTGETVQSSSSELIVPPDGAYDIDVVYGQLRVDYISDFSERFVAIVIVNQDTTATSLPELLNAVVPPTDAQLLEFQAILADCVTAQTAAEAAAASIPVYGTAATKDVTTSSTDTTAGRVTKVGDFGLGSIFQGQFADIPADATLQEAGFKRDNGIVFPRASSVLNMRYNNARSSQLAVCVTGTDDELYFRTQKLNNIWGTVRTAYHSGNSGTAVTKDVTTSSTDTTAGRLLKFGDFGIGEAITLTASDNLDNIIDSGFYYNPTAGNVAGNNYPVGSAGSLLVLARSSTNRSQTFVVYTTTNADISWTRTYGAAGWSSWRLNYDSGNTNFNVFGGLQSNSLIGVGAAGSSTSATVLLPINSITDVSSITIPIGSTFKLVRANGVDFRTGIPASDISAHSSSSNRVCRLIISGNTGLLYQEPLELRQDNAAAKITVNF